MKFDNVNLEDLRYTTPYFLLSESAIREKAERFYKAFSSKLPERVIESGRYINSAE